MNLAAIFQVLQHFNDFEVTDNGGHFVFQNEANILHRFAFIAIYIPCKCGEDIVIHE